MEHYIQRLDMNIDIPKGSYTALKAMSFLKTSKASQTYTPTIDDICQYGNKLGAVVGVQDQHILLAILKCDNGAWSFANDVTVVRCDEVTLVDDSKIANTVELGCASLYRSIGSAKVEYPKQETVKKTTNKRWW